LRCCKHARQSRSHASRGRFLSPWTDLVGTVASRTTRNTSYTGESINALANFYAGTEDKHNLLICPINADLQGFPPLRIDVGSDEVLLDDSLQVAEHAKAADVPVELTVWEGMWYVFQQYSYISPEGQQSL
jgi:acetyl esterase/lipase